MLLRGVVRGIAAAAALVGSVFAVTAQPAADFYKGKTIRLVVGASASGGYTGQARKLALFWGRHIPGNPNIIVQNMPAGAGISATNHIFNVADKDGTEIGLFNRYTLQAPLLGVPQALYKPDEFNWLGTTASYNDDAYIFIVRSELPIRSVQDLQRASPPLNVGNVGAAPIRVLQAALGLQLKVITGYRSDGLDLAFERGEIDGHTVSYRVMLATKPHWVTENKARILIQFGRTSRLPQLADVPTAREIAPTPADAELLAFTEAPLLIGYPFAAPPGVPADRVTQLRQGFDATMADASFKAELQRSNLDYSPKTGAQIAALVHELASAPASVIARYKAVEGGTDNRDGN